MVEHQPRLLGSRVRFPAGAFAIFSVSAKASLPVSLSLFPFLFLSHPLPFLSSSSPFDLVFAQWTNFVKACDGRPGPIQSLGGFVKTTNIFGQRLETQIRQLTIWLTKTTITQCTR